MPKIAEIENIAVLYFINLKNIGYFTSTINSTTIFFLFCYVTCPMSHLLT